MAPRSVGPRNGFFPPSSPPLYILIVTRGKDCPNLLQHYSVIRGMYVFAATAWLRPCGASYIA